MQPLPAACDIVVNRLIQDLVPFFAEPCRLFVLLARRTSLGVILRRGPSRLWRASLWDTRTDQIQRGQWFRGTIYPEKCDLSPKGDFLLYFAAKFGSVRDHSYGWTWTAVSRPPFFTALALWPNGSTYGGGGTFLDDRTLILRQTTSHHPNHPPGPLHVERYDPLYPHHHAARSCRNGWSFVLQPSPPGRLSAWRKSNGCLALERATAGNSESAFYPSRQGAKYTLLGNAGEIFASFVAQWADFDFDGILVAASGGRIFRGDLKANRGPLHWSEIASMASERFAPLEAPAAVQTWDPLPRANSRNARRP